MNKKQITTELQKANPLTMKEAKFIVETVFKAITEGLLKGKRTEIRGFGSLCIRQRKPRAARNPKTNTNIAIGERSVVYFRAGKELLNKVNKKKAA
ncbi:HU family DNA-binding protein [Rickettsiales endosymbiont of Stachyamoeba lipophora]|uniref:HU family DNA-binding protein n=1 Tax=Rickettsiales endosymbiont of Stachyamoeba lipophora TaxID=2486578 RepID=UPI000F651768|nr:HU family DNA-binding protein [Rickettsiales endosymbiont of Stachyamoeba lipophora]AZL15828.1 integration host factor subunit beta [Rickettsiales endosymbiont of Stachyamoeba lipophora]